ncbi:hypothetical protein [Enterococcus sp. HY326]|uniref:hypothetical protein n=1 Tax=Enterococcus sp. HY326 TaxID=2971265 RepID=UPI00223FF936|nr:hypothetical protein [Enterococcus sp. HY326]
MSIEKLVQENAFTYDVKKDAKVFIYHYGKQVMILKGKKSAQLLKRLDKATIEETQLILAKVTGNFKRGNERTVNK